jgi:hypothetical protein
MQMFQFMSGKGKKILVWQLMSPFSFFQREKIALQQAQ